MGELFWTFLKLGLTSFGGPIAHLAYFRDAFVVRRQWLSERDYADLVALCQALPGPASSQVGFAIGLRRGGLLGGLSAWLGFTAPSAIAMAAIAVGVGVTQGPIAEAVLHGLKLVAVTIVAHAVFGMARSLLQTRLAWALALATLIALALIASPFAPLTAIAVCAAIVVVVQAFSSTAKTIVAPPRALNWTPAAIVVLLIVTAVIAAPLASAPLATLTASVFKAGALVFGGGHVVLPLLQAENAAYNFIPPDAMLAGYGAVQMMPGPLFTIASFLGMASAGPVGALVALIAIFLPGLALVWAFAPLWDALSHNTHVRAGLSGANAAVVGVIAAAWATMIAPAGLASPFDIAIAVIGFAALQWLKAPILLVALCVAIVGAGGAYWI